MKSLKKTASIRLPQLALMTCCIFISTTVRTQEPGQKINRTIILDSNTKGVKIDPKIIKNLPVINPKQANDTAARTMSVMGTPADSRTGAMEAVLPTVVMPAPNSAVLTRMISDNVDLYTGKLNIEIPIYTLKSRNIEVPISIQGNCNSIKVNDIGSWVGLGMHLNAGGMITRVMKNLPDEFTWNFSGNRIINPTSFNFRGYGYLSLNSMNIEAASFDPPIVPYAAYGVQQMRDIIKRGNWNTRNNFPDYGLDLQPDEFYFNFGKHSGKFVFDRNGQVVLTNNANLIITPTIINGNITQFVVTSDDGYKYEFGNYSLNAVEESKLKTDSKTILFTYRWTGCYAAETINVGGTPITLNKYIYESSPIVMSYLAPVPYCYGGCTNVPGSLMDFYPSENNHHAEYVNYSSTWHLTKITSPTGDIVTFNYVNNGTITYLSDRTFSASGYEEQNRLIQAGPYNCNNGQPWVLPSTWFASYAPPKQNIPVSDFWHYPTFSDYTISASTIELSSKKLQEIVTSQGYKVEFIANTSRPELPGDERLDKIVVSKNGELIREYLLNYDVVYSNESYEQNSFSFRRPVYNYYSNGPYCCVSFQNDTRTETGPYLNSSVLARMYLKTITEKGANQETIPPISFEYYNIADLPFRTSKNQDKYGYARDVTVPPVYNKLLAGVLKKITYPTGGTKEFLYDVSGNTTAWNGLKVTQIKEQESPTASAILKNYTYGVFQPIDQAVDLYYMSDIGVYYNSVFYIIAIKRFATYGGRVNPEMQTRSAAGGYSFAEVSQTNNGKYRVEFTTGANTPDSKTNTMLASGLNGGFIQNLSTTLGQDYPFPQATSNDWKRGLPTAEYYIKPDGKNVKSNHYEYDFTSFANGTGSAYGLAVTKYNVDFGTSWSWSLYGRYTHYPTWQLLKSKTERDYHSDGLSYLEKKTDFSYNKIPYSNREFIFQNQITQTSNSKGEQVVQKFKFPLDYAATSDVFGQGIAFLKTKNIFNAVVEKYQFTQDQSFNNKRYTEGVLNRFHTDKPLVKQSYIFQPDNTATTFTESGVSGGSFVYDAAYKPALNFNTYDSYGNIEEQNEESDGKESYIWDYNKTHPVAKASNASLNDVAFTSFEADGTGNWTYNQAYVQQQEKGMTGKKYFEIPVSDKIASAPLIPTQKYRVTFWCKYADPIILKFINGGGTQIITPSYSTTINGWKFYDVTVENVTKIEIAKYANVPKVIIDEVRLFPVNSQMVTYTFDPLIGMTSQCDPNNRIVYYEYDGLQRLKLVKDQYGNVVKTYEYNYKQ